MATNARSRAGRPKQMELEPENEIEAKFLNETSLYNQHDDLQIAELSMQSAQNDLNLLAQRAALWPQKRVQVKSLVTFALPGKEDMLTEEVIRTKYVDMTVAEAKAAGFFGKVPKAKVKKKASKGPVTKKTTKKK